jgi:hypothetical protein
MGNGDGSLPTADEIENVMQAAPLCLDYSSYYRYTAHRTNMTAPLTPQTPSPTRGSPVSLSSTSTLVNGSLDSNDHCLPKAPARPSSASLVLEKLQEILEYVTPPS